MLSSKTFLENSDLYFEIDDFDLLQSAIARSESFRDRKFIKLNH